jgi:hypothetical protein
MSLHVNMITTLLSLIQTVDMFNGAVAFFAFMELKPKYVYLFLSHCIKVIQNSQHE